MKKRRPASNRLDERAARGSQRKFEAALAKIADVPADTLDQLPAAKKRRRKVS